MSVNHQGRKLMQQLKIQNKWRDGARVVIDGLLLTALAGLIIFVGLAL